MGMLDAALAWAARGFRVFPLQENSKDPRDIPWTSVATTDPAAIRAFWTDPVMGTECDYNVGFLTTGFVVADVDVKNGKKGMETFFELGLEFDTLTARTANDGYHLIYKGDSGASPLGRDIDVRSHNGYIVAPGSIVDGKAYTVELDIPVADFPGHLRHLLKPPRVKKTIEFNHVDLDSAELVEVAAHWLLVEAKPAIEGQGGDGVTYQTACRLRDLGLSEDAAADLMVDEYNPRCEPPWDPEELRSKVANAYLYATGAAGSLTPGATFDEVVQVKGAMIERVAPIGYAFNTLIDAHDIRPRPWVFGTILQERVVTTLTAIGGGGKSVLSLIIAAHLAVGKSFLGMPVLRKGKSIVYNAEDDLEEMSRRLIAVCEVYDLDLSIVRHHVALVSGDDVPLKVTKNTPPIVDSEKVNELIKAASDPEVVMICVDPVAEIHTAQENDNMQMNYVMGVLRMIARMTDTAVFAIFHTGKPPVASANAWVGQQGATRGASSIGASARVALTLFPASESDAEDIGIPKDQRGYYVRLDGAKATFSSPAARKTRWLKWHTREIKSGDEVGVLLEHDARSSAEAASRDIATALLATIQSSGGGSLKISEATTALRVQGLIAPADDATVVRKLLNRILATPVETDCGQRMVLAIGTDGPRVVVARPD